MSPISASSHEARPAFRIAPQGLIALQAIVLVLAGWWVYFPALHGAWIWDDSAEISQNAAVQDPAGLGKIWLAPVGADYLPVKTTVQWAEWRRWGDHTLGYHVINLGLHLLSALLLWQLLRRCGIRWAWLGGLLFAIHPLAVESVAWISELKNTLSLALLLGAILAYLEFDASRSTWSYLGSLFLFLLALLSKSSVVMFPGVILLYAWWQRGKVDRRDLLASAPFFLISLALGLTTIWFQHARAIAGAPGAAVGVLPRLAGAGWAVAFYLAKAFVPTGFMPIYPGWKLDSPSLGPWLAWLGLALVGCGLWRKRAGWGRPVLFGLGWFFLNLIPVLGLVPMSYQRISWVADHFAYLPLVGLIGLAAAGAGALQSWICPGRSWPIALAAALLCALLARESHRYAGIFRGERTLWGYAVERNPNSTFAQNNFGKALFLEGHPAEAAAAYARALQLDPGDAEAHYNLGNILAEAGRVSEAISEYRQAIALLPDLYEAHNNLGLALAKAGRSAEGIDEFQTTLRLKPGSFEARCNLADALEQAGRIAESIDQYELALRLKPDAALAHENLGMALAQADRVPEAIEQFQIATRIDPKDAGLHYNLGLALRHLGRLGEAAVQFDAASRLGGAH